MRYGRVKYQDSIYLLCVFIVSFLCAIGYSLAFKAPLLTDAKQFDILGWNLAQGKGYVDEEQKLTMFREPAYPYFLSIVYMTFGHRYEAVFVAQAVLFAGIALMSFFLAKYIFGIGAARLASIVVALFPTLGNYTIYLLSEVFFAFCLMLFLLILSRSLASESYIGIFASGIILAVLALTKAIMLFFVFFIIFGFFTLDFGKKQFFKKFFLKSLLLLFSFTICVAPWMARNKEAFGTYSISLRVGKALYNRAVKLDYGWDRWRKIEVFSLSEYLGNRMYPGMAKDPSRFLLIEDHIAQNKLNQLMASGLSPLEADKVLAKESLEKIKSRPFAYLGQSALESIKLLGFTHIPSLNERKGGLILSFVRGVFRISAYPIFIFCLAGISISLNEWRKWLVVSLAIIYITVSYGLTFSWARYTVPLIPCYVIFAAIFIKRRLYEK